MESAPLIVKGLANFSTNYCCRLFRQPLFVYAYLFARQICSRKRSFRAGRRWHSGQSTTTRPTSNTTPDFSPTICRATGRALKTWWTASVQSTGTLSCRPSARWVLYTPPCCRYSVYFRLQITYTVSGGALNSTHSLTRRKLAHACKLLCVEFCTRLGRVLVFWCFINCFLIISCA